MATDEQTCKRRSPAAESALRLCQDIVGDFHPRYFAVRFWDEAVWEPEPGHPARFTLVLKHPGAVRRLLGHSDELTLAEAYLHDEFDIEGDIEEVFPLADFLIHRQWPIRTRVDFWRRAHAFPAAHNRSENKQSAHVTGVRHSKARDRQAIAHHYGFSEAFWTALLGDTLVYSCAHFASVDDDLSSAQIRKLDTICRKLRLRPGECVADIGCGWGSFILHAAQRYGVHAVGITVNDVQKRIAEERIRRRGLGDRCRVELCDYRELKPAAYDKIASVEMFEHVGESMLPQYFAQVFRALRPGGVFLNQGIAIRPNESTRTGGFANRYVFPDGQLVSIGAALIAAEAGGFELCDVESFREHYALTLRHWVRRLHEHHALIAGLTDEVTYRVFRLYLSNAAYRYRTGRYDLYQTLLARPSHGGKRGLPLTRADWYG